jgi:hypothetical protein
MDLENGFREADGHGRMELRELLLAERNGTGDKRGHSMAHKLPGIQRHVIGLVLFGLIAMAPLVGCSHKNDFTIKVSGTKGVAFDGDYIVAGTDGKKVSYSSKPVRATVPRTYFVKASYGVGVRFAKRTDSGVLRVEIGKNGKTLAQAEASQRDQVVNLEAYAEDAQ